MKKHHPLDYTAPLPNAVVLDWLRSEHQAWVSAQFFAMSLKRSARIVLRDENDLCNFRGIRKDKNPLVFYTCYFKNMKTK